MRTDNHRRPFCEALLALRRKSNWTQAETAQRLGISDKTYSKWETGENDPTLSSILRLAEIFAVSPAYFFEQATASGDTETAVDALMRDLSPEETVQRCFDIQFHAIRGVAKRAVHTPAYHRLPRPAVPENRVNPRNAHAITAFAGEGVYEMMYNGEDANLALSFLPHRDNYAWLRTEQAAIGAYLTLLGREEMLRCLPFMLDAAFAERYTADYLAEHAGIEASAAKELLDTCVELDLCTRMDVHIGDRLETLYRTVASPMLIGILTLAHLSLPSSEKNGCYYVNMPARQILIEGEARP